MSHLAPLTIPIMLAVTDVVSVWSLSAGHLSSVFRPAVVAVVLALVVTLTAFAVSRRVAPAVTIATLVTAIGLNSHPAVIVALLALAWAALTRWQRLRGRAGIPFPATGVTAFAALLLTSTIVGAADGVVAGDLSFGRQRPPPVSGDRSSIYVLLLDGYPRADTLMTEFGYDNRPFTDGLTDLGFTTYSDAISPAARTELTLLSMLGGDVDSGLPPSFAPDRDERRIVREAMHKAPASTLLANAGYWRVHIASPISHTNFSGWDESIDTGQLTELEANLLQRTALSPLLDRWVVEQQSDRLVASFDALVAQTSTSTQKVVLTHIMAPHPPFLWDRTGGCWAEGCGLYAVRPSDLNLSDKAYAVAFARQLDVLNPLLLDTIRTIIAADREGIVVVMSDHGARHDEYPAEWRRSLLAVRGSDALDGEHSVRDLFARLLLRQER